MKINLFNLKKKKNNPTTFTVSYIIYLHKLGFFKIYEIKKVINFSNVRYDVNWLRSKLVTQPKKMDNKKSLSSFYFSFFSRNKFISMKIKKSTEQVPFLEMHTFELSFQIDERKIKAPVDMDMLHSCKNLSKCHVIPFSDITLGLPYFFKKKKLFSSLPWAS